MGSHGLAGPGGAFSGPPQRPMTEDMTSNLRQRGDGDSRWAKSARTLPVLLPLGVGLAVCLVALTVGRVDDAPAVWAAILTVSASLTGHLSGQKQNSEQARADHERERDAARKDHERQQQTDAIHAFAVSVSEALSALWALQRSCDSAHGLNGRVLEQAFAHTTTAVDKTLPAYARVELAFGPPIPAADRDGDPVVDSGRWATTFAKDVTDILLAHLAHAEDDLNRDWWSQAPELKRLTGFRDPASIKDALGQRPTAKAVRLLRTRAIEWARYTIRGEHDDLPGSHIDLDQVAAQDATPDSPPVAVRKAA